MDGNESRPEKLTANHRLVPEAMKPAAEVVETNAETILVVDDDDILRTRLAKAFQKRGFDTRMASCFDEVVDQITDFQPDRAVIDLKMPGKSGLEILKKLLENSPGTKAVILTGYGSISNAVDAIKLGAINYVTKPANADEILASFLPEKMDENRLGDDLHPQSLAEAEWDHIQRVLSDCNGNISEAARQLDIPRRTLQRKLKKLAP